MLFQHFQDYKFVRKKLKTLTVRIVNDQMTDGQKVTYSHLKQSYLVPMHFNSIF